MKVRTASRSSGGVVMSDSSRTPDSASCKVRGIGVAVSVSTWTLALSSFSRSLCLTPKCCSSSITRRPRDRNLMPPVSSACVPTTMSTSPDASPSLVWLSCLRGDQPRRMGDLDRQIAEAIAEGRVMLARQQRRRHHHRHLLAVHRRHEGGAQRHLGLAESDIAADQPVHRPTGLQILDHRLRWRRADPRFPHRGSGRRTRHRARRAAAAPRRTATPAPRQCLISSSAISRIRSLSLALRACQRAAAQPVELDPGLVRAEARDQLDILHRQEQPVVAGIGEVQAVMRRALHVDDLQAFEAADPVLDMHHQVAGGQALQLGDEIGCLAMAPGRAAPAGRRECPARR